MPLASQGGEPPKRPLRRFQFYPQPERQFSWLWWVAGAIGVIIIAVMVLSGWSPFQ